MLGGTGAEASPEKTSQEEAASKLFTDALHQVQVARTMRGLARRQLGKVEFPLASGDTYHDVLSDIEAQRLAAAEAFLDEARLRSSATEQLVQESEVPGALSAIQTLRRASPFGVGELLGPVAAGVSDLVTGGGFAEGFRREAMLNQLRDQVETPGLAGNVARGLGTVAGLAGPMRVLGAASPLTQWAAKRLAGPTIVEKLAGTAVKEPLRRMLAKNAVRGAVDFAQLGAASAVPGSLAQSLASPEERGILGTTLDVAKGVAKGGVHGLAGGALIGGIMGGAQRVAEGAVERLAQRVPWIWKDPIQAEKLIAEPITWTAIEAVHSTGDLKDRIEQASAGTIVGLLLGGKGYFRVGKQWAPGEPQAELKKLTTAARRLQIIGLRTKDPSVIRRAFEGAKDFKDIRAPGVALLRMVAEAPPEASRLATFESSALRPDENVAEVSAKPRPDLLSGWFSEALREAGPSRVAQDFQAWLEGRLPAFMLTEGEGRGLFDTPTPQELEAKRILTLTPASVLRLAGADVVHVPGKGTVFYWPRKAVRSLGMTLTDFDGIESGPERIRRLRRAVHEAVTSDRSSRLLGFGVGDESLSKGRTIYVGLDEAGNEVRTIVGTKEDGPSVEAALRAAGAYHVLRLRRTRAAEEAVARRRRMGLMFEPLTLPDGRRVVGRPLKEIKVQDREKVELEIEKKAIQRLSRGLPPPVIVKRGGKLYLYDPLPPGHDPLQAAKAVSGDLPAFEAALKEFAGRAKRLGSEWVAVDPGGKDLPLHFGQIEDAQVEREAQQSTAAVFASLGVDAGPYLQALNVDPKLNVARSADDFLLQRDDDAGREERRRRLANLLADNALVRVWQSLARGDDPQEAIQAIGEVMAQSPGAASLRVPEQVFGILQGLAPREDTVRSGGWWRAMQRVYRAVLDHGDGKPLAPVMVDVVEAAPTTATWTANPGRMADVVEAFSRLYGSQPNVQARMAELVQMLRHAETMAFGPVGVSEMFMLRYVRPPVSGKITGTYKYTDYTKFRRRSLDPEEDEELRSGEPADARVHKGALQEFQGKDLQDLQKGRLSEGEEEEPTSLSKKVKSGYGRLVPPPLPEGGFYVGRAEHVPDLYGVEDGVADGDFVLLAWLPRGEIVAPSPYQRAVMRGDEGRALIHEYPGLGKDAEGNVRTYPLPVRGLSRDMRDRIRAAAEHAPSQDALDDMFRIRLGLKAGPTLVWRNPEDGKFYVLGREAPLRYIDELHLSRYLQDKGLDEDITIEEILEIGSTRVRQELAELQKQKKAILEGKSGLGVGEAPGTVESMSNVETVDAEEALQAGLSLREGATVAPETEALATDPRLRFVRVVTAPDLESARDLAERIMSRESEIAAYQEERNRKRSEERDRDGDRDEGNEIKAIDLDGEASNLNDVLKRSEKNESQGDSKGGSEGDSTSEGDEGQGKDDDSESGSDSEGKGKTPSGDSGVGKKGSGDSGSAGGSGDQKRGSKAGTGGAGKTAIVLASDGAGRVVLSPAGGDAPPAVRSYHLAEDLVDPALVPDDVKEHMHADQIAGASLMIRATRDEVPREKRAVLNADGGGVGKTRQNLAFAKYHMDQGRAVIYVTHPAIMGNPKSKATIGGQLMREIEAMGMERPEFMRGKKGTLARGKMTVVSYHHSSLDALVKSLDEANAWDRVTVVFDESHALKNVLESKRAAAGLKLAEKAHSVAFVSATALDDPTSVMYLSRVGFAEPGNIKQIHEEYGIKVVTKKGRKVTVLDPSFKVRLPNGETLSNRGRGLARGAATRLRLYAARDRLARQGRVVRRDLGFDSVHVGVRPVELDAEDEARLERVLQSRDEKGVLLALGAAESITAREGARSAAAAIQDGLRPIIVLSKYNPLEITTKPGVASKEGRFGSPMARALVELEKLGIPLNQVAWVAPDLPTGLQSSPHPEAANVRVVSLGEGKEWLVGTPEKEIELFQSGKKKVMLLSRDFAGVGIDLDDQVGDARRKMIFLAPPTAGDRFVQVMYRVLRRNTQSPPLVEFLMPRSPKGPASRAMIHAMATAIRDINTIQASSGGAAANLTGRLRDLFVSIYKDDPWAMDRVRLSDAEKALLDSEQTRGSKDDSGAPPRGLGVDFQRPEEKPAARVWELVRAQYEKLGRGQEMRYKLPKTSQKSLDAYLHMARKALDAGWGVYAGTGGVMYLRREAIPVPAPDEPLYGGVVIGDEFRSVTFRDGWAEGLETLKEWFGDALKWAESRRRTTMPLSVANEIIRLASNLADGRGPKPTSSEDWRELQDLVYRVMEQLGRDDSVMDQLEGLFAPTMHGALEKIGRHVENLYASDEDPC